ncbi:PE-PPE domain-containing protein, partial [Mycolicibacterium insubricum]
MLALTPGLAPVAQAADTTRTVSADARLAGNVYYLRGTNIGNEPTDNQYVDFVDRVLTGTNIGGVADDGGKINYPASIWPVSKGYFNDPKWNDSVAEGVDNLGEKHPTTGDVVFGFSQ